MSDEIPQRPNRFAPRQKATISHGQKSIRPSLVLHGLAVILAIGVALWLGFLPSNRETALEIQETLSVETGEIELTGARYRGVSSTGRPYEITAEQAQEAQDGTENVNMALPKAVIATRNGATVKLQSNRGVFNKGSNRVDLVGDVVVIQHSRSLRLDTEALHANLKSGDMYSNAPVEARDPNRQINASSMRVYNNGERIVFEGDAKMVIRSDSSQMPVNFEIKS